MEQLTKGPFELSMTEELNFEKTETRDDVLNRWENAERMTDEQLLDAMRYDGELLVHVTAFAPEAAKEGYVIPTRIINERSGNRPDQQAVLHPSAAVHFGLNSVYTDKHNLSGYLPGNKQINLLFSTFVSHPGIQMANRDFSVELNQAPYPDIKSEFIKLLRSKDSQLVDVMVRGRTEDPWDLTSDIDIRSGFFLVPNLVIDPNTLQQVNEYRLTKEEYDQRVHFSESKQAWVDSNGWQYESPEQYKYAITTKQYWEQILSSLPEDKPKPRIYFYDGESPSTGIAQFRQAFDIPEPKTEKFIQEIEAVGSTDVVHKFTRNPNFMYGSGEGHGIRLNSNNAKENFFEPLGGINLEQFAVDQSMKEYNSIKSFIETHNPGPEWYQSQITASYHYLLNIRDKINTAYTDFRKKGGESQVDERLIGHLAPELVKARARFEEIMRFWTTFIVDLEKQNWKNWEEPEKREVVRIWDRPKFNEHTK